MTSWVVSSVPVALSLRERDSKSRSETEWEPVSASFSCRVNLFSLKCRVQRSKFAPNCSTAACHLPHATCHLLQYVTKYIYIGIYPTSRATICRSMFPAWYMTFYYGNSSRLQLQLQLTQANHIMKATNFNYDHYNKTLERRATTRRTNRATTTATRRRRATAALMGKLPWLMPQPKNSFSRVKVITIYRPQKSVAQHKSKWTRQAQPPPPHLP